MGYSIYEFDFHRRFHSTSRPSSKVASMTENKEIDKTLLEAAIRARENAYAPYSKFKVGSSFRLHDGRVFSGANMENCVLPLTVCAERNALAAAIAAGAKRGDIAEAYIVIDSIVEASPCGACRQVMAEFMDFQAPITVYNLSDKKYYTSNLEELLPKAFTPDALPED